MIKVIGTIFVTLLMGGVALATDSPREPGPNHKRARHERQRESTEIRVVFSSHDVRTIREYYAPRHRRLPPGLQKKLARTGSLPPGWQKKMEPFPVTLERELAVLPREYRRGVLDGHAVIYNPRTQVIIDVTALF